MQRRKSRRLFGPGTPGLFFTKSATNASTVNSDLSYFRSKTKKSGLFKMVSITHQCPADHRPPHYHSQDIFDTSTGKNVQCPVLKAT